ncbi:MAG: hypothetical protein QXU32_07530 [Nitrososphaerales archaeon]
MAQNYQRARQVARNVLNSKAFSVEEREAMKDLKELDDDEIIYVVAWLKGAALASSIVSDFQHNLK